MTSAPINRDKVEAARRSLERDVITMTPSDSARSYRMVETDDLRTLLADHAAQAEEIERLQIDNDIKAGAIRDQQAQITAQAETIASSILLLREMADLMEGVISGEYTPDSFTTQPARVFLAKFAQPCSRCGGEGCVQVGSPESWSLEDCLDCGGTGRDAPSKALSREQDQ